MREKLKRSLLICGVILFALLMVVEPINLMGHSNVMVASAASVKLNKTSTTLPKGTSYQLKVSGSSKKVKWSSSKSSVASVSSKGKVTTKKAGTAVITAKVGTKKLTCKVKVLSFKLNKTSVTIKKGSSYTLKVTGTKTKAKYSSANSSVATVSSTGKITGKGNGATKITVKVGKESYKVTVTVKSAETVVNCPDIINIQFGETKTYTITAGDGFKYGADNYSLIDVSITPSWFHVGDKLTMTVKGTAVGSTYLKFESDGGWTKNVLVNVTGSAIPSSIITNPLRNCSLSNFAVYKEANVTNPSLFVKLSMQNYNAVASTYLTPVIEFYDQAGNVVTKEELYWENPTVGGHDFVKVIKPYGDDNFSTIVSCKIVDVEVRVATGSALDYSKIIVPASNTSLGSGIYIDNFAVSSYTSGYYVGEKYIKLSYTVSNRSSKTQSFSVYFDFYDEKGNLIKQDYEIYDNFYSLDPGETDTPYTSTEGLYGSLETGNIASIRARLVLK